MFYVITPQQFCENFPKSTQIIVHNSRMMLCSLASVAIIFIIVVILIIIVILVSGGVPFGSGGVPFGGQCATNIRFHTENNRAAGGVPPYTLLNL